MLSEPNGSSTKTRLGLPVLRQVSRAYARLGQFYFWIGTVLVLWRMATPLWTPSKFALGPRVLDWVLWFFFWPVLLIWEFGLFGYERRPGP